MLSKGFDFPRRGLGKWSPVVVAGQFRVLHASQAQPDPGASRPARGKGVRGPSTRRSAAPQAPMLVNPAQTTILRFPKSSLPDLSHSGLWGADLWLLPTREPGAAQSPIGLRIGASGLKLPRSPWE